MISSSEVKANPSIWLFFCLAVCSGLGVANVYYLQPGLSLIQNEFGVSPDAAGWLAAATQICYGLGMLLLAPLGDILPRRKLVTVKAILLLAALTMAASAHSFMLLVIASMVVGLLGSIGQDFIPIAAQLAPDNKRGHLVGIVTTGLLTGILLSRTLGGWISQLLGWREMQYLASFLMLIVLVIVRFMLPEQRPTGEHQKYSRLMSSLWTLWRTHRVLRISVMTQACLGATLGAFWSCLAFVLTAEPFHFGPAVAGSFGIAGAAGALAAPVFGKYTDRKGPLPVIRFGCILVILSFVGLLALPPSIWALIVGAVLFDLGAQAGLVSHQIIVTGIGQDSRSRTNGLLMTGAMVGMALGAVMGSLLWSHAGSTGLFSFAAVAGLLAFGISFGHSRTKPTLSA